MRASRAVVLSLCLVVLVSLVLGLSAGADPRKAGTNPGIPKIPANMTEASVKVLGVGTQSFDNDTPFRRDGTDGGTVGNRFEVGDTNPPHSIATVTFAAAGNFATSVVMTVWDVNAASVMTLARSLVTGVPQSPMANLRFTAALGAPIVGHNGSFIAGLRNTDYDIGCPGNQNLASTCDGVALTQGAGGGGGPLFRAARVNFTSPSFIPTITVVGSTGANLAGINAIFRVTGDNLPVELMQFDVE